MKRLGGLIHLTNIVPEKMADFYLESLKKFSVFGPFRQLHLVQEFNTLYSAYVEVGLTPPFKFPN